MPSLADLGPRIVVMGPSNSGKSTLADAIGRAHGLAPIHLDQLHHLPHTDWQPRPPEAFAGLHDEAIAYERWVMDGNYSRLLPARLARATGLILLDVPTAVSLWRYLRRCWFETHRVGALPGGRDSVKWAMLRHITTKTRANRRRYRAMIDEGSLPLVLLATPREVAAFYRREGLRRRSPSA